MKQTIGLCGGTFDPIHLGHVALVDAALASTKIDACILMPAGRPPHKSRKKVMPAAYRYEMTRRAFEGRDDVVVSDLEMRQAGPSYTLKTVRAIKKQNPDWQKLYLIYGSDILLDIEKWHQPEAILAECPLLLARRGGYGQKQLADKAARLRRDMGADITFFDCPQIDLSSTRLRQDLIEGKNPDNKLPPAVFSFIRKHDLYRDLPELETLSAMLWQELLSFEQALWPDLTVSRLLHSLNVMRYSLHLAQRHAVSPRRAGLAGLLHDCAKCLPAAQQLRLARQSGDDSLLHADMAHAPAGKVYARDHLGIADPGILKAILCHTTGCADMNRLDKILFLADKIEPARHYQRLDPIRALAQEDLDRAMLLCLSEIDQFLKRTCQKPHPYAQAAADTIQARIDAAIS